jgi:hypothetical protein
MIILKLAHERLKSLFALHGFGNNCLDSAVCNHLIPNAVLGFRVKITKMFAR